MNAPLQNAPGLLGLGAPVVDYGTVVAAVRVTFAKLAAQAFPGKPANRIHVDVDTKGGPTARVTWRGSLTDPHTSLYIDLSMPSLPAFLRVPRAYAERLVGYLIHELQHVRKSDANGLQGKEPLLAAMINGLEDCRIEAELVADGTIPNAKVILSGLAQALLAEALAAGWTLDSVGSLPFGAAILGRHCLGHDLQLAGLRVGTQFEGALALMRARLATCHSTAEITALAEDMLGLAREAAEQQPKVDLGKPEGDTQGDGEGEDAEGEGEDAEGEGEDAEGEGEGEDAEGEGEDAEGEDAEGEDAEGEDAEGEDAEGEGEGEGEGQDRPQEGQGRPSEGGELGQGDTGDAGQNTQGEPQEAPQATPQGKPKGKRGAQNERVKRSADHDDALKNLVDAILDRNDLTAKRLRSIPQHIRDWQGMDNAGSPAQYSPVALAELHAMVPNATMIREYIRRLLKAPAQASRQHYRPHGRLDRRAFPRMAMDAPNVFTKRTRADAVNTAVGLLLDNSGSMEHQAFGQEYDRNTCQKALAVTLAEACKHADVDCHISTFGHHNALATVKDWNHPLPAALATIAALAPNIGHTPLAASMMGAIDKLAQRTNRTKRILIVLTDGDADEGQPAMDLAQDYARAKGVHVIGVQIGSEKADAFKVGVGVIDSSNLSQEVLGALLGELRVAWAAR